MRMKEAHMLTVQRKAGYNTQIGTENKFVIGHDDFPESADFKNVRESSLKCYEQGLRVLYCADSTIKNIAFHDTLF